MDNRIELTAIAPFFVIWALTRVVSRIVAIQLRAPAESGNRGDPDHYGHRLRILVRQQVPTTGRINR